MFAVLINVIIILLIMKIFFKFMYPKPPRDFFPKEGDDTSLRHCDYCGHSLATYRGIVVHDDDKERFFCNDEHQSKFYKNNPSVP
ncbi:hypothetical protein LU293_02150 [Moraxella nasovis]|uniref:hypothetical protein n=1 Tax=Moraxella nasovis TaxID=2904121 RepID=UPI001F611B8B|nr:hypothetical protein [Moraxella nasovis]UNU73734.1 hypothetical protein LU293_02150 [Moraxella nasovis]